MSKLSDIYTPIVGVQGFQGDTGTDGVQGFQGTDGIDGVQGFQGDTGIDGVQGFQGSSEVGVQGFQGTDGTDGVQGFQGSSEVGVQGFQGTEGLQGFQGSIGPQASSAGLSWEVVTNNDTIAVNEGFIIDASSNTVDITLPVTPSEGDTIGIKAIDQTNTVTLLRNGSNIEGSADDLVWDIENAGGTLVYSNATVGWTIVTEIN